MKEIGQSFREAREKIGLSKEEVIKDLNISVAQLDNLEDGNTNAFKDIFFLKDLIEKYAIYLNLDKDEIINTFNEYIFSYTSRIPVEDILEQTREITLNERKKINEEAKISSPYTKEEPKTNIKFIILLVLGIIVFVLIVFLIISYIKNKMNL